MPGHATLTAPSVQALTMYLAARSTVLGPELGTLRRGEVAAALGCSARTLARALALLVEAGAIEVDKRRRVIIRDDLRLETAAAGERPPALLTSAVVGCMSGLRDEVAALSKHVTLLTEYVQRLARDAPAPSADDLTTQVLRAVLARHHDTRHHDTPSPSPAGEPAGGGDGARTS